MLGTIHADRPGLLDAVEVLSLAFSLGHFSFRVRLDSSEGPIGLPWYPKWDSARKWFPELHDSEKVHSASFGNKESPVTNQIGNICVTENKTIIVNDGLQTIIRRSGDSHGIIQRHMLPSNNSLKYTKLLQNQHNVALYYHYSTGHAPAKTQTMNVTIFLGPGNKNTWRIQSYLQASSSIDLTQ